MAAGKYNITVEKGSSYSKKFTYKDGEGVLINLSGYTARMKAKRSKSVLFVADTALVDMTTENGKITLGGALGIDFFMQQPTLYGTPREIMIRDVENLKKQS